MEDFRSFETIEDLLAAGSFLEYCRGEDARVVEEWEDWINRFPEKRSLVVQAKQILIASIVEMDDQVMCEERLRGSLGEHIAPPLALPVEHARPKRFLILAAAACFSILVTFLVLLKPFGPRGEYVHMQAEAILPLYFPDSTLMVLNKGASVRYRTGVNNETEVFIEEGEVFFDLDRSQSPSVTVFTTTGLKIKDIGTAFSVKSSKRLSEDVIQVQDGIVDVYQGTGEHVRLGKDHALRIDKASGGKVFSRADKLSTSGWLKGEIALYDVRFDELASALSAVFEKRIILEDPRLTRMRVTILFRKDQELGEIMEQLSMIYNLAVSYENRQITIALKDE